MNRTRLFNLLSIAFAGAAAAMLVLAALLPFYLLFKIDYAPTLASNAIIERTPPDNAIALQNALGPLSFPFALLGGIMLVAMLGLVVGPVQALLRRVNPLVALVGASLFMPLLVWSCFPDHMTPLALAPFLATGPLLHLITRRDPTRLASGQGISRRDFLLRMGVFSFGGLALSVIDGLPLFLSALNATRPGSKLFDFAAPAPRAAGFPAPRSLPEVTPSESFYVMRKFPTVVPPASPDFQLVIDGAVDRALRLSMDELRAMPRTDSYITRQCVSNPVGGPLISTALFSGVPLRDVLANAGVQAGAVQVKFYGRDGYDESVSVEYALQHGLIAYAMNGTALSEAHGPPLKMEIPGLYGFKNMKWLTRIELITAPYRGIWAREGWTETAIYKTMSRIDAVTLTSDGSATACGVAFAGLRGIAGVEVQVNDGEWRPATLHTPPLSGQTWVQWRADLPERGDLSVTCRASDGAGERQIETKQTQFPDGASGLHTMAVKL